MTRQAYWRELSAGNALFDAGNIAGALAHSDKALALEPEGEDALLLAYRLRVARRQFDEALAVMEQLVTQHPKNVAARILHMRHVAARGSKSDAEATLSAVIYDFADQPDVVELAHLEHDLNRSKYKRALRRIKRLRSQGAPLGIDLDGYEIQARRGAEHIVELEALQAKEVASGHVDGPSLNDLAITRFKRGRFISAFRLAGAAASVDPARAPIYRETQVIVISALLPPFWFTYFLLVVGETFIERLPLLVRFICYIILSNILFRGVFGLLLMSPLNDVLPEGTQLIDIFDHYRWIFYATIAWWMYAVTMLGSIGRWRLKRAGRVKLSDRY